MTYDLGEVVRDDFGVLFYGVKLLKSFEHAVDCTYAQFISSVLGRTYRSLHL